MLKRHLILVAILPVMLSGCATLFGGDADKPHYPTPEEQYAINNETQAGLKALTLHLQQLDARLATEEKSKDGAADEKREVDAMLAKARTLMSKLDKTETHMVAVLNKVNNSNVQPATYYTGGGTDSGAVASAPTPPPAPAQTPPVPTEYQPSGPYVNVPSAQIKAGAVAQASADVHYDVAFTFESQDSMDKVNAFLDAYHVSDKWVSRQVGNYAIYVGKYPTYIDAQKRSDTIQHMTGLAPKILVDQANQ